MNKEQFDLMMQDIVKNHRWSKGGRWIKYIDPIWDMRDLKCFCIKFRGAFNDGKIEFSEKDDVSMFDEIMEWLNGSENL